MAPVDFTHDARSLNEFQRLDVMIPQQDSSAITNHQSNMPYCMSTANVQQGKQKVCTKLWTSDYHSNLFLYVFIITHTSF